MMKEKGNEYFFTLIFYFFLTTYKDIIFFANFQVLLQLLHIPGQF